MFFFLFRILGTSTSFLFLKRIILRTSPVVFVALTAGHVALDMSPLKKRRGEATAMRRMISSTKRAWQIWGK